MFLPALVKLGTPEQQAKWVPKALNLRIIGTYAQTGSFSQLTNRTIEESYFQQNVLKLQKWDTVRLLEV